MTCVTGVPQDQVDNVARRLRGFGLVDITITPDGNGAFTVCGRKPEPAAGGAGGPGPGMETAPGAGATGSATRAATRAVARAAAPPKWLRGNLTYAAFTRRADGGTGAGRRKRRPGASRKTPSKPSRPKSAGRASPTKSKRAPASKSKKPSRPTGGGSKRKRRGSGSK